MNLVVVVLLPDVPGCPSMYHHNEGYPNPPHSSDGNFTSSLYTFSFFLSIEAARQKGSDVRIGCVQYPSFLSLVKALWSLANRCRVSMSPLANQQHVHVYIGSSSRPHPCLKNPWVNTTGGKKKKSPPVPLQNRKTIRSFRVALFQAI